jgi:hypothetical protein
MPLVHINEPWSHVLIQPQHASTVCWRFAAMMSGLDIHYELGEGHKLLGRRMPDLDLVTPNGPLRVFTLLRDARPLHLNFGGFGGFDITPWRIGFGRSTPVTPLS